ncbi:hypothetical protein X777_12931, partial [Ooceraea biroi]
SPINPRVLFGAAGFLNNWICVRGRHSALHARIFVIFCPGGNQRESGKSTTLIRLVVMIVHATITVLKVFSLMKISVFIDVNHGHSGCSSILRGWQAGWSEGYVSATCEELTRDGFSVGRPNSLCRLRWRSTPASITFKAGTDDDDGGGDDSGSNNNVDVDGIAMVDVACNKGGGNGGGWMEGRKREREREMDRARWCNEGLRGRKGGT